MIKKNIIIEDRYLILPVKRGPTPSPTLLSPYGAWPKKNKMLSRDLGHLRIKKNITTPLFKEYNAHGDKKNEKFNEIKLFASIFRKKY